MRIDNKNMSDKVTTLYNKIGATTKVLTSRHDITAYCADVINRRHPTTSSNSLTSLGNVENWVASFSLNVFCGGVIPSRGKSPLSTALTNPVASLGNMESSGVSVGPWNSEPIVARVGNCVKLGWRPNCVTARLSCVFQGGNKHADTTYRL